MGQSGIEPRIEFGSATHSIAGAAPEAASMGAANYRLRVAIDDGKEQAFPVGERPFLECAPGEHKVMVALGDFLGRLSLVRLLTKHTLQVTVEDGHVTEVALTGGPGNWTLVEAGKRPR